MKRHKEILNAYSEVKEANPKRLHLNSDIHCIETVNILWFPGIGVGRWMNRQS